MKHRLIFFFFLSIMIYPLPAQDQLMAIYVKELDLEEYFAPYTGSFVLLDLNEGNHYQAYNDSIRKKRYSPCSTFKIVNSLIAVESGVAEKENYLISYDTSRFKPEPWMNEAEPFKYWMQDHTMTTAIRYSVVWYYQELARRIGGEHMKYYLNKIDYGNNDISSGLDHFWLCGSLQVSADEQVEFLKKLYNKEFSSFSEQSQQLVLDILPSETTGSYRLYGKTGGGRCWNDKIIGWYVGFVENATSSYAFAMNIFVDDFIHLQSNKRIELTKDILRSLGIIAK